MDTSQDKKNLIEFVEKTELKGINMEPTTVYYTTQNGFFCGDSLSFDKEIALAYYKRFLELQGNMTTTKVLDSAYLNTETII